MRAQVMWLVAEAEARFAANSTLNLQLALDLARLQSVAYCWPGNGALWHCTRWVVAPRVQDPLRGSWRLEDDTREPTLWELLSGSFDGGLAAHQQAAVLCWCLDPAGCSHARVGRHAPADALLRLRMCGQVSGACGGGLHPGGGGL